MLTESDRDREKLLALMQQQVGRDQALKAGEIVEMLTGDRTDPGKERIVREIVQELRRLGCPICSDSAVGYWWPATADELRSTMDLLHQRGLSSLYLKGKLARQLSTLEGQLGLPWLQPWVEPQVAPLDPSGRQITIAVELPEELHQMTRKFLQGRKGWDQEKLIQAALSLYLIQEGFLELTSFFEGGSLGSPN
jgi:hypothetical protein